ncbi:MAG TPA: alkaline phosphatase family protein [Clostridia bacterium]|nr:alkaline phosphatase family protein [Clostridia bacterium]
MPFCIFMDALSFSYAYNMNLGSDVQIAGLKPDVGYSSNLHWQLFCNMYPDEIGFFTDWSRKPEPDRAIRMAAGSLKFLDGMKYPALIAKRVLGITFFKGRSGFANIPFRFRKDFRFDADYLFNDCSRLLQNRQFMDYSMVIEKTDTADLGDVIGQFDNHLKNNEKKIFCALSFPDYIGHKTGPGEEFNSRMKPLIKSIKDMIEGYVSLWPHEPILIVSDHGMSRVNEKIDIGLEKVFGRQGNSTYIAFRDSEIMRVYSGDKHLLAQIGRYLEECSQGHLMTESERVHYGVTSTDFGDLIFILHEGYSFRDNWYGKSLRPDKGRYGGGHGFWPFSLSDDGKAVLMLMNSDIRLDDEYDYKKAYTLISSIMGGHE